MTTSITPTQSNKVISQIDFFKKVYIIRAVEEALLSLFEKGKLFGTTHTCIGEEISAVALATNLSDGDVIFSNHRCHGHYLARTDDVEGLLAEVMGKVSGTCSGYGGSQHLCNNGFYSNGIQGSIVPVSTGIALGMKLTQSKNITTVFIGDGTLGEGVIYEAMNMASKWSLPILFVLENNKISQSTPQEETLAGSISKRFEAFDIKTYHGNTWNFEDLIELEKNAVNYVRKHTHPAFIQVDTFRLRAHSKGDDTREPELIAEYEAKDPLNLFLKENKDNQDVKALTTEIIERVNKAIEKANEEGFAKLPDSEVDNYKEVKLLNAELENSIQLEGIKSALDAFLADNDNALIIGEDIRSPYGGAFKVTRGLSDKYPERVINTPVSEAGIAGIGNGLALQGCKPIVEFMFGDFIALAFDQLVNNASKFRTMYNYQVKTPIVFRTPMGGGRGYGPTHSQSLEKYIVGIPDIRVFILHGRTRVNHFYKTLLTNNDRPAIVCENKLLYIRNTADDLPEIFHVKETDEQFPTTVLKQSDDPDITVVAFGRMTEFAESAAVVLHEEEEIITELIYPLAVYPLNIYPILESVRFTKKLVIIEEGTGAYNLGSEIIADLSTRWVEKESFSVRRIAADNMIPSAGPLEKEVLPNKTKIVNTCKEIFNA